jgi:hypothetical protein
MIHEVNCNFFGQHIEKSNSDNVQDFLKGVFGAAILYPVALTFSKLSILAFYDRLFGVGKGKIPMRVAGILNLSWMAVAVSSDSASKLTSSSLNLIFLPIDSCRNI